MATRVNKPAFSAFDDDLASRSHKAKPGIREVSSRTPLHCLLIALGTFIFVFLGAHTIISLMLPPQEEVKPQLDVNWHSPDVKADQRHHGMKLYERMKNGEHVSDILKDPNFGSKHFNFDANHHFGLM